MGNEKIENEKLNKILEIINFCEELEYLEPAKIKELALEAFNLSKETKCYSGIVKSLYFLGKSSVYIGKVNAGYNYLLLAKHYAKHYMENDKYSVDIYEALGLIYNDYDEIDIAMEHFKEGHKLAKKIGYSVGKSRLYNSMGIIYSDLDEHQKAIEYFMKSEEVNMDNRETIFLAKNFLNICEEYIMTKDIEKARAYLEKSKKTIDELGAKSFDSSYLFNLGKIEKNSEDYVKSIDTFEKALANSRKYNNIKIETIVLSEMADVYNHLRRYDEAKPILKNAIILAEKSLKKENLAELYNRLAIINEVLGKRDEALENYKIYCRIIKETKLEKGKHKLRFIKSQSKLDETIKEKEKLEFRNTNLKEVSEICQSLTSEMDIENIFFHIDENISKLIKSDRFSILFYDDKKNAKVMYSVENNMNTNTIGMEVALSEKLFGFIDKAVIIDIENTKNTELINMIKSKYKSKYKSMIYIPLNANDIVIGGIVMLSKDRNEFSTIDKDLLDLLSSYISIAIMNGKKINELKEMNGKLDRLSKIDPLTHVGNRRSLSQYLEENIDKNIKISVALIDIDYFKNYNDM